MNAGGGFGRTWVERGRIWAVIAVSATIASCAARPADEVGRMLEEIRAHSVYPEDEWALAAAALRGITERLDDRYALYLDGRETASNDQDGDGMISGVGIQAVLEDDLRVVNAFPESPAAQAGLRTGDRIVEIDGRPAADVVRERGRLVARNRGDVKLRIARDEDEPFNVTLSLADIPCPSVRFARHLLPQVGYAHVARFDSTTAPALRRQIEEFRDEGARGVIIDLRFNPGGDMDACREVASLFVDEAMLWAVERRDSREVVRSIGEGPFVDLELVFLVNQRSASAAEMLAGSLRDLRGAGVVGSVTHGKCAVQSVYLLDNGASFRFTTGRIRLPSGLYLDGGRGGLVGLQPDRPVDLDEVTQDRLRRSLARLSIEFEEPRSGSGASLVGAAPTEPVEMGPESGPLPPSLDLQFSAAIRMVMSRL